MNYESTLRKVRELAENATLRPAPKRLPLVHSKPALLPARSIVAFEDKHPPRKVGVGVSAHGSQQLKPRAVQTDAERFRSDFKVLDANWASMGQTVSGGLPGSAP